MHIKLLSSMLTILILLLIITPNVSNCCLHRGDIDHSGGSTPITISDLIYLINYLFAGGPLPACPDQADIDGSGPPNYLDINDVVFMVNYMFDNGPAPPPCTPDTLISGDITVFVNQSVFVEPFGFNVSFDTISFDNRCPFEIYCFQAGKADINLTIELPNLESFQLILPINGLIVEADISNWQAVESHGFRFILISLLPYPNMYSPHPYDQNQAHILIEEL